MFKVGDIIDYGFYRNLEITGLDDDYYYLKDFNGNVNRVYKSLVNKHGKLVNTDYEFKVGDTIDYGMHRNLVIVNMDNNYFYLKDYKGSITRLEKDLVNKWGKVVNSPDKYKIGDKIRYHLSIDLLIVGETDDSYIVQDYKGQKEVILKSLINKNSELIK